MFSYTNKIYFKKMTHEQLFSPKLALTDTQLRDFCEKNKLPYHLVDIEQLDTLDTRYSYVFTGNTKDYQNEGHTHHWLFADGDKIFDSYGKNVYHLPEGFSLVKNHPVQLQEWDSTVCGEYASAWFWFIYHNKDIPQEELPVAFSDHFGFTSNKRSNDEIVFNWFKSKGEKQDSVSTAIAPKDESDKTTREPEKESIDES
jgi:hypothetical protein